MEIRLFTCLMISLFLISYQADPSTFSNFDQIIQKKIEGNYKLDFDKKIIDGTIKIYFHSIIDGEVIILDTSQLTVTSVIDSDTGDSLEYVVDTRHKLDSLGTPLKIYRSYDADEDVTILIKYQTSPSSEAVQWLSPEMTSGKKYPFLFTQCESILCRSLLPCQDTPTAKVVVSTSITVQKPLRALNSGLFQGKIENANTTTYFYHQKIPIPSYLIAIAAGAIEERILSDRTKVYAELEMVDKAAREFSDTERFLEAVESYTIPYEWGEYNIIVLPPSFPYGGMENPTLTFATPSIVAGDKSLADVIAHEISHSWSGNLVTMKNWSGFWLNEGFTMFLQRKIEERINGVDMAKLSAQIGLSELAADIYKFGESNDFTSLTPDLVGRNPDDAFSTVPYEKGFNLVYYLEQLVNSYAKDDLFKIILRRYFEKFKYSVVEFDDFKNLFEEEVRKYLPEKVDEIMKAVNWDNWVYDTGFPVQKNDFTNDLSKEIDEQVELFFNEKLTDSFKEKFVKWHTYGKQYFLSKIYDDKRGAALSDAMYKMLVDTLDLKEGYNAEVNYSFFLIMLNNNKTDAIESLDTFLGAFGRMKYIRPLYLGLAKINKQKALEIFEKYKAGYHPVAVRLIEADFKTIV